MRAFRLMLDRLEESHHAEPLFGEEELDRLLRSSTGAAIDYPLALCAHELVSLQAQRSPDAVAVAYGDHRLTYQELDEKSSRLASYLIEAGVGLESRVGIHLRRSPEMLIALLGVLKCGAAYVPLRGWSTAAKIGVHAHRLGCGVGAHRVRVDAESAARWCGCRNDGLRVY